MNVVRALFVIASVGAVAPLHAQNVGRDQIPTRFEVGLSPLVAEPVGTFADYVDEGFGINAHGLIRIDEGGILGLRFDAGFINYGNEAKDVCFSSTVGCRVVLDLNTSNDIVFLGVGPQLTLPLGPLRPYVNGGIGLAYFATTSGLSGDGGDDGSDNFVTTTNFDDTTFSTTAGGGVAVPFRIRQLELKADVGARYHNNGVATYLREGDIEDRPNGEIVLHPQRSEANLVTYHIGFSARLNRPRR